MQSQGKFEVYIELLYRFYDLVSLNCITILKILAVFRSLTWSAGGIFSLYCF